MNDNAYIYIISPIVLAVISGIGYLVKYVLARRDKKHAEEIEERNKKRDEIENSITNLKSEVRSVKREVNKMQAIILSCDKPDCPSKTRLAQYFSTKAEWNESDES